MKSITYEELKIISYKEFLGFKADPEQKALMDFIARRKERWTALDILGLEEIPDEDKLWCVLREELIDPKTLHEFACVCAERALRRVENPDPRSVAAIEAKRAWIKGEISDAELAAARDAAWVAARDAAWGAAWAATMDAASAAAWAAAWAAARDDAWAAERTWQVEELKKLLMEAQ